ncbi:MAG: ATP-grasp domain-containing protein [Clostridia bacterium]|nr:ATP-grasp domain-containing protein [Clostridia bacterium]
MFSKILIANRGEVAVRIIRACREMGIKTVAIYSEADAGALHTALADERICIGPARASESYLNQKNILSAALATGAQAIHPGYGFLAENGEFARLCRDYGVIFIGPDPDVLINTGDKRNAKELMRSEGVPVVPGSGIVKSCEAVRKAASEIGYPLLVKASAGGGGKGIRLAANEAELDAAFETASAEAKSAFGNGDVMLEKYLVGVRHVEVQILADTFGNVVGMGERDCSLQIGRQKVIEETPSPAVSPELRRELECTAVRAAKAAGYTSAGTVEFLLDKDGNFYFMEMNARLQVEHGVTEEVTGVDIVKWQIRIASEMPLREELMGELSLCGCSMECRINAKSAGKVEFLHVPGYSRTYFATALTQGCSILPYYDSMLGKLIVWAPSREEAIRKMEAALCELVIEGVETNIADQLGIIRSEDFKAGRYDTGYLQNDLLENSK